MQPWQNPRKRIRLWNRVQHWRLPLQFWPKALVGWFAQAEYIFQTKRLTDSFNKYCYLAVVLSPDTIRLMMDIIDVTPAQQPYESLKERLFSRFKMSEYERWISSSPYRSIGGWKQSIMLAAILE
jgi:hypothetical protein